MKVATRGKQAAKVVTAVEAIDDNTVKLTLNKSFARSSCSKSPLELFPLRGPLLIQRGYPRYSNMIACSAPPLRFSQALQRSVSGQSWVHSFQNFGPWFISLRCATS